MSDVSAPPDSAELPAHPPSRNALREHAVILGLAFFLAFGIRSFVVEPFRIPSSSMLPTLLVGDHLFVDKSAYGARIPFTSLRLPARRAPARGDIVVFTVARRGLETAPADREPDWPREEFVKRIVGLPGDQVAFHDWGVSVNGEAIPTRPLREPFRDRAGRGFYQEEVRQGERVYRIVDDPTSPGPPPPEGVVVVEPGRYFALGDNRDHSKDSRVWGTVRLEEIRGPAVVLYWSWDWDGPWSELLSPFRWWELLTTKTRWERVGQELQ